MRVITNSEELWDILGTRQRIFSSCCILYPPLKRHHIFFPLLFSSSSLLIAEWPPSLQRASVRLVESIDYHRAVLDGAVWLDACNCGVIKHWHWGFNGGLSNSLTFSAARRGEHGIYSCWRETKEEVCFLCWIEVHSRVFMLWKSVIGLMYSLWFMSSQARYTHLSHVTFSGYCSLWGLTLKSKNSDQTSDQ